MGEQNRNTARAGVGLNHPGDNCWALTNYREGWRGRGGKERGPATRCIGSPPQPPTSADHTAARETRVTAAETKRGRGQSRSL